MCATGLKIGLTRYDVTCCVITMVTQGPDTGILASIIVLDEKGILSLLVVLPVANIMACKKVYIDIYRNQIDCDGEFQPKKKLQAQIRRLV